MGNRPLRRAKEAVTHVRVAPARVEGDGEESVMGKPAGGGDTRAHVRTIADTLKSSGEYLA